MNDAGLREPGRMKMRYRISLACFRTLERDHIQDVDVRRQNIRAQLLACLEPTHLTIEVAHRHHLPVEVKRQAVDTFRERRVCLQVAHCAIYAIDRTAEMLPLKRAGEAWHHGRHDDTEHEDDHAQLDHGKPTLSVIYASFRYPHCSYHRLPHRPRRAISGRNRGYAGRVRYRHTHSPTDRGEH